MALSRLVGAAGRVFKKYPLPCNCTIYGTFYVAAEYSQQRYNHKYAEIDLLELRNKDGSIIILKLSLTRDGTLWGRDMTTPDCIQFYKDPDHPEMNYAALPKFAFVGGCVYSPMLYFWYSRVIDKYMVGKSASMIIKKVALDQGFMTPILLVAFFTTMSVLEGKEDVFAELREKFARTFLANQVFWVPAQTLNFLLVPPPLRVLYVATVSFVWINALCWIKRQSTPEL